LRGLVPKKRYAALEAEAAAIESAEHPHDLQLTETEQDLLEEAYAKEHSSSEGVQTATATVRSSSGIELDFEVVYDADGPIDAHSPYDAGFDTSDYIELH
jgi:hypothetical protein